MNLRKFLQKDGQFEETMMRENDTFSRSILASEAIRVSRMRFKLTIHFSPSPGERLRRCDMSEFVREGPRPGEEERGITKSIR